MALLEVEKLTLAYLTAAGPVPAVRDASFQLAAAETLALVGETGSGKSTLALALLGLLEGNGRIESGEIRFEDKPLSHADRRSWNQVRGSKIGMVFQDARGSLNPVLNIGSHLIGALRAHQEFSRREARRVAIDLLGDAGIPEPRFYMRRFPSELSGGMCQRVAIALAVCNQPKLLVADEPTSALDPSVQAQILLLLRSLRDRLGLALLLISHDLALVSEVAERVLVMYHGRLIESGKTWEIYRRPAHPYTAALLACQANLENRWDSRPLAPIPGFPPPAGQEFTGCPFAPRCTRAVPECPLGLPAPFVISESHWAACIRPLEEQPLVRRGAPGIA